jgi:hypothetical protein
MSRERTLRRGRVGRDFETDALRFDLRPTGAAGAGLPIQEASRQGVGKTGRPPEDRGSTGAFPANTGSDWPFT